MEYQFYAEYLPMHVSYYADNHGYYFRMNL